MKPESVAERKISESRLLVSIKYRRSSEVLLIEKRKKVQEEQKKKRSEKNAVMKIFDHRFIVSNVV